MSSVHPSATIGPAVELADDVQIGPNCVLEGTVRIGAGTRLIGSVHAQGPLSLGAGNVVYPFACLGFAPQDRSFDAADDGAGTEIGDENVIRESVTIHRATSSEQPTRLGHRNYLMVNSHLGHDAQVGNDCSFANGVALAGHVEVGDRTIIGGNTVVHQFCIIGRGCMLTGGSALSRDLAPYFMLTGINLAGSLNLVGLRRSGRSAEEIADARWAFRVIQRQSHNRRQAMVVLEERADRPIVRELLEFLARSKRGICPGTARAIRGLQTEAALSAQDDGDSDA